MKRVLLIFSISIFLLIFLAPLLISRLGSKITPSLGESTESYVKVSSPVSVDYFKVAETVDINAQIDSDAAIIAKTVNVNAKINGSAYIIAENINIKSEISDNLYSISKNININGPIQKNARIVSENAEIRNFINKNLSFIASRFHLTGSGEIGKDLYGLAGKADIAGRIGRDVIINVDTGYEKTVSNLKISGRIGRDLKYKNTIPKIDNTASILGRTINLTDEDTHPTKSKKMEILTTVILSSLVAFLTGLIIMLLNRRIIIFCAETIIDQKLNTLLIGLYALVILFTVAFLSAITIIGLPITILIALFLFLNAYIFLLIPFGLITGNIIFPSRKNSVLSLFSGIFVLSIVWLNPTLSGILSLIMSVYTLGSIYKLVGRIHITSNI